MAGGERVHAGRLSFCLEDAASTLYLPGVDVWAGGAMSAYAGNQGDARAVLDCIDGTLTLCSCV
jgi:hypothetical protein